MGRPSDAAIGKIPPERCGGRKAGWFVAAMGGSLYHKLLASGRTQAIRKAKLSVLLDLPAE